MRDIRRKPQYIVLSKDILSFINSEKENIDTLDSKGELILTIMSSIAQEESRSISENTTWGIRKSLAEGNASVAYSRFLGYDKDFQINPVQAAVVKEIYRLYLSGYSSTRIANLLKERGIPSACGKASWSGSVIRNILRNEKYKGAGRTQTAEGQRR